ncbi:MAG: hypothetical protein ABFD12_06900 [Syntrophorhabdus sp.]
MDKPGFFAHRKLKREAQKIIDRIMLAYPRVLASQPDAEEDLVIRNIYFEETGHRTPPEDIPEEIAVCCKTINGLSYLLALQFSAMFNGAKNFAFLQFTRYLDNELASLGFPPQSLEQKEEILTALKLDVTSWRNWDESMK